MFTDTMKVNSVITYWSKRNPWSKMRKKMLWFVSMSLWRHFWALDLELWCNKWQTFRGNPDEMWYAKIQLHTKNENYNPEYSIEVLNTTIDSIHSSFSIWKLLTVTVRYMQWNVYTVTYRLLYNEWIMQPELSLLKSYKFFEMHIWSAHK